MSALTKLKQAAKKKAPAKPKPVKTGYKAKATKTEEKRAYNWTLNKTERQKSYESRWRKRRSKYGKSGMRKRTAKKG